MADLALCHAAEGVLRLADMMSFPAKFDRPRRVVFGALVCLLSAAPASLAASGGMLTIEAPWCLSAQPAANAAGYLVIVNKGDIPDRLTEISSPVAQSVSIHESRVAGGLATMTALGDLVIPARTSVRFAPGSLHFMLETLRRPLKVGERVPITLWFKVAGRIRANLLVVFRPPTSASLPMQM